jgi:MoxR-like ATPase
LERPNSYEKASALADQELLEEATKFANLLGVKSNPEIKKENASVAKEESGQYIEITLGELLKRIQEKGIKVSERLIKRYHLSLKTRGFVILSGISGVGKTWLTEVYADSIGAELLIVPVAPNWTTNEDLLGYLNPIDNTYRDTPFSNFLRKAHKEFILSKEQNRAPKPYHLVLDEMNLARIEYYFAKFLSLMEIRSRNEEVYIELSNEEKVLLPPNLYVIGTVNVDETTHGFADKVYDRAQLIEVSISREDIYNHIGDVPYRDIVMKIWDLLYPIAPFAYRVVDEIKMYINEAEKIGGSWVEALDEQILQKVLPKIKGTDIEVGKVLEDLITVFEDTDLKLSLNKASKMHKEFTNYGVTSYF